MRILTVLFSTILLCAVALWSYPVPAHATAQPVPINDGGTGTGTGEYVRDYQAVRKVGLALSLLGFFLGLSQLHSELPSERHKAERLITLTLVVFLLLVGDRMIAQGAASWFGFDPTALPVFWQ